VSTEITVQILALRLARLSLIRGVSSHVGGQDMARKIFLDKV